ncbi:T9SS type A sorting domain-containing protein [Aquimarina latercula]|uniref:T9SS type A sorting domain-containing protein n=1 Tax=Aquimarina latercula TaxID=987 RepID=UPI00040C0CFA|nr:T9SS type A sorting domain-containing protein [Aquimarina latercula]
MKNLTITLSIFLLLLTSAHAQISQGGEPLFSKESFSKSTKILTVKLPKVDMEELMKEDAREASKDVPLRFAYPHDVNLNPEISGKWFTNKNGDKFWLLALESKGAKSLNLTFSDFYLPVGSKLFIYNEDKTDIKGAFTSSNNKETRKWSTAPILGDKIIIEYYQPSIVTETPSLQIATIAHDYRGVYGLAKAYGDSGSCNNNVNCVEGNPWKDQIRSVALITLANGTRFCTGALINNTSNDGTPYFLTADHCTGNDTSNWVFVFNYQSTGCGNTDGSLGQSISGSQLLRKGEATDYSLLRLSATPPSNYNVYYSGWDARGVNPTRTTGIHHPSGDIKKISFDNDTPSIGTYSSVPNSHWRVNDWDDGTTEPGSSGSPLFDQNKRIVGQLHGGGAACGNNEPDYYGRFDLSFPNLKQWLAPGNNSKVVDGFDPAGVVNPPGCKEVKLTIKFDNYPEETSWALRNSTGTIVESGGTYESQADGSTLVIDLCLDSGCYNLTMNDTYGDGMCCSYGSGSYSLTDSSGILASGASFGSSEVKNFCVGTSRVSAAQTKTDINKITLDNLSLYPNPAANNINIDYKIKNGSSIIVSVIDMTGRVIKTKNFSDDVQSSKLQIGLGRLPKGSYFLKITENSNTIVKKFVISK